MAPTASCPAAAWQRHSQEARANQLLDGQSPTATPGADPQGEVYGSWCWRCAASITSMLAKTCSRGSMTHRAAALPDEPAQPTGSIAAGFRRSIHDADCDDVELLGWPVFSFSISPEKKEVMARRRRGLQKRHPRRHPAVHPALDRALPGGELFLGGGCGAETVPSLASWREHMP